MEGHEHTHELDIGKMKLVGSATIEALRYAKSITKPGERLLDVAEKSERFLRDRGFDLAFPINLSIGSDAAHYTPSYMEDRVFTAEDVVKLDFGAAKDGILGDCAVTVDLSGKHLKMVEAAEKALDGAISMAKAGVKVREIGREINRVVSAAGFRPIQNLGGHGIESGDLHTGAFVPNFDNGDDTELEEGMVIAIEPFVTDGRGVVSEGGSCEIYDFVSDVQIRSRDARDILAEIMGKYPSEPFAVRWLSNVINSKFRLYAAISELVKAGAINPYPVLTELGGGTVAQAEAEMVVQKGGCEIIAKV
ncbi:MAG: type II methionyl aminopeptidase [Candidatus Micrarchaeota archaeon]|nr:type II methionyl aminopeptidase [Candidatus Micrarchaeota archaeon]